MVVSGRTTTTMSEECVKSALKRASLAAMSRVLAASRSAIALNELASDASSGVRGRFDPLEAVRVQGFDGLLQPGDGMGYRTVQPVTEPADQAKAEQRHRKQHVELDPVLAGVLRQVRGENEHDDEDLHDAGRHR